MSKHFGRALIVCGLVFGAAAEDAWAVCWDAIGNSGSGCFSYPTSTSCTTATAGSPGCCCWLNGATGRQCDNPSNDVGTNCPNLATSRQYCGTLHSPCAVGQGCSDGVCLPCTAGTFANMSSIACTTWSPLCMAGQYQSTAPTAANDRVCTGCASGTFSAQGASACTPWTTCVAGSYQSTAPSATSDRVCMPCVVGTFSTGGATVCTICTACTAGQFETSPCTLTADRVCMTPDAGTTSADGGADAATVDATSNDDAGPGRGEIAGCSCQTGSARRGAPGLALLGLALLLIRRRRRHIA